MLDIFDQMRGMFDTRTTQGGQLGQKQLGAPTSKQMQPPAPSTNQTPEQGGSSSLLDRIVSTIAGTPDDQLTPEQMAQRRRRRSEAGQEAAAAANGDLGDSNMNAPAGSSSGFGLQDLIGFVRMFGGGGG